MFLYPHAYTPTPEAQAAARALMARVRAYMDAHPDSELHTRGKMFGVLLCSPSPLPEEGAGEVLSAFSGLLDGSYYHEGFVPPIFEVHPEEIVGVDREDSRRKQEWLFAQYRLLNAHGHVRTVLDCFRDEPTFGSYPPSGTGECCAPKLLQECYRRGLKPVAMAEFWMGASPRDEVRREGEFYPACIAKCRPLLRHMLAGMEVEENPLITLGRRLASKTRILYEDEYLWVVSKPSGLLTVPGREGQYSLVDYLSTPPTSFIIPHSSFLIPHSSSPSLEGAVGCHPAHRLDMDTSGIVLVAKTPEVLTDLQRQFRNHEIEKTYIAQLEPPTSPSCGEGRGEVHLPLSPNPLDRPRQRVDYEHGKRAVTRYEFLPPQSQLINNPSSIINNHSSFILLSPLTGRTHQLRVHCAHSEGLGRPIVGDRLYGSGREGEPLRLHAMRITFRHPATGALLTFEDCPDWAKLYEWTV